MTIHEISKNELHKKRKEHAPVISYYKTAAGFLATYSLPQGIYKAALTNSVPSGFLIKDIDDCQNFLVSGTKLQINTWKALCSISKGRTVSYSELAKSIDNPKAHRAVANAVGANPIAYFIPCHRVVRKNGDLGGYAWGIEAKKMLLQSEGIDIA